MKSTTDNAEQSSERAELIEKLKRWADQPLTSEERETFLKAAAMLSSDAKPVRDGELPPLPEPAQPASEGVCCGNFTTGAEYMGQRESLCCGQPDESRPDYYTADQMRDYARAALLSSDAPAGVEAVYTIDQIHQALLDHGLMSDSEREDIIASLGVAESAHPQPSSPAGGEAVACSCAECGKTSTKDSMWALYCLDCIQEHSIGGGFSLRPGYERLIDEYIENYEFTDGDAGYHDPSEFEQAMIKDAFMGFDFSTIYTHPQPARTAEPLTEGGKTWAIDHSAGRPILVLNGCSVIEAEDAEYVLALIKRDAEAAHGIGKDQA